jgi:hypothetical protein
MQEYLHRVRDKGAGAGGGRLTSHSSQEDPVYERLLSKQESLLSPLQRGSAIFPTFRSPYSFVVSINLPFRMHTGKCEPFYVTNGEKR